MPTDKLAAQLGYLKPTSPRRQPAPRLPFIIKYVRPPSRQPISRTMQNLPPTLKPIGKYLARALEFENQDPIVSYYCNKYSLKRALELRRNDQDQATNLYIKQLLDKCDVAWATLPRDDGNGSHRLAVENLAVQIFEHADAVDRASQATKDTALSFFAVMCLLEVSTLFGPLRDDLNRRLTYSRFKASDITKAIKDGRRPKPGGKGENIPPPDNPPNRPAAPSQQRAVEQPRQSGPYDHVPAAPPLREYDQDLQHYQPHKADDDNHPDRHAQPSIYPKPAFPAMDHPTGTGYPPTSDPYPHPSDPTHENPSDPSSQQTPDLAGQFNEALGLHDHTPQQQPHQPAAPTPPSLVLPNMFQSSSAMPAAQPVPPPQSQHPPVHAPPLPQPGPPAHSAAQPPPHGAPPPQPGAAQRQPQLGVAPQHQPNGGVLPPAHTNAPPAQMMHGMHAGMAPNAAPVSGPGLITSMGDAALGLGAAPGPLPGGGMGDGSLGMPLQQGGSMPMGPPPAHAPGLPPAPPGLTPPTGGISPVSGIPDTLRVPGQPTGSMGMAGPPPVSMPTGVSGGPGGVGGWIPPPAVYVPGIMDIRNAQRYARNAVSALDFQDMHTAIHDLEHALRLLKGTENTGGGGI